jgi:hypothetical protein
MPRSLSARNGPRAPYVFKKFRGFECGSPAGPGSNGRRPGKTLILKYDRAYITTSTSKGQMVLFSTGHLDRRGLECNQRENRCAIETLATSGRFDSIALDLTM